MSNPEISIVTPCFNMLSYLRYCVASVKDQQVNHEHIIVDGDSSDGTKEWLKSASGVRWISEKDKGMYDALNKGLAMAKGEIIGHINADEQYLPGTLNAVVRFFEEHPETDYITGDFLIVDAKGDLIAYRKAFPQFWPFFFSNYLYSFTCTFFYRKKVAQKLRYNMQLKSIGDADFFYNVRQQGFKGSHLKRFMATFMYTSNNLSHSAFSIKEKREYEKHYLPAWFKLGKIFFRCAFYFARIVYRTLWHKGAIEYEIYSPQSDYAFRKKYISEKPTWRIKGQSIFSKNNELK